MGKSWTAKWPRLASGSKIDMPPIEDPERPISEGPLPDPVGFGPLQPIEY
ncbi:hypothetical protein DC415_20440 [Agrobacterium tumefaciens]|uniref:Uncharacterized protein n=1 Tax=Rhizobium rhizogenes TaxID=359 RepID=A0AA92C1G1_RHIRH|nr:hypothetical protein DC430_16100 [Rhizobium rhizogenes]PVE63094.1 hypothetical protein DC415_20440 [Agrobacterium tumefaciens]PVE71987.1 hypothetical protein DCP16_20440 [Sphingomonas sp. TPD3009]